MQSPTRLELQAKFMAAVRGIPAYSVACALGHFTHGIIWKGCGKGHMAEAWADANDPTNDKPWLAIGTLRKVDLQHLSRMARAHWHKDVLWYRTE